MATIVCQRCPKTFKTETGFTWHQAHQHEIGQAGDNVDPISGLGSNNDGPTLSSRIDDLEDMVGLMSDLGSRITNVQTSLGLAEDSDETVADLLAALEDRLKQLKLEVSYIFQLSHRLNAVEAKTKAQEGTIAQLGETVLRLSHLLKGPDVTLQRPPCGTQAVRLVP